LRYAYKLRDLRLYEQVGYDAAADTFPDLLIRQLAVEVEELLARGLRRTYVQVREELGSPRGRIDIQSLARKGGLTRAALPCIHHPRSEDILLNRAVLAGLRLAIRITNDSALRVTLCRLAATLAGGVSTAHLDLAVLDRTQRAMSRLTVAYAPALTLIRMLVEGEGVSLEDEGSLIRVPGYLFDMNRLFQSVLSRFLSENLTDYTIRDEFPLRGMLAYHPLHNPWNRPAPTPRPDYAVLSGTKVVALLDAKYMNLWDRKTIGRDALYQLALYALSQPPDVDATILYPTTDPSAREARVVISDPVHGASRAHVIARPVHLERLEACLSERIGIAAVRERAEYARELAFGAGV
jgi:5-methylcytosine-specific restriction enzyme subunit McrC